jgi:hypothetical protein
MSNAVPLSASDERVWQEIEKMVTKKLAKEKWIPPSMHGPVLKEARENYIEYCKTTPVAESTARDPRQSAKAFFKTFSKQSPIE